MADEEAPKTEILVNSRTVVKELNEIQENLESRTEGLDKSIYRTKKVTQLLAMGILFNNMMQEYEEEDQKQFKQIISEMESNIFYEDVDPEKIDAKA